ncbi:uncharacterized protein ACR2FA_005247 [Aphomia sociella]
MAKFIKSLFQPNDVRRSESYDEPTTEDTPPLDSKRKLSMSRSGKLKQLYKKRHSLSMELYGENYKQLDKPKSLEYHVNNTTKMEMRTHQRKKSTDSKTSQDTNKSITVSLEPGGEEKMRRPSTDICVREIENAFDSINKS